MHNMDLYEVHLKKKMLLKSDINFLHKSTVEYLNTKCLNVVHFEIHIDLQIAAKNTEGNRPLPLKIDSIVID